MRKALVVGIDVYKYGSKLTGCTADAQAVSKMLERHADTTVNFDVQMLLGSDSSNIVTRDSLRQTVQDLFISDDEVVLFYFAGHGHIEATGGYLCAGDTKSGGDGVPLSDIVTYANNSKAQHKVIILDSCHGGVAGDVPSRVGLAELTEGMTILTASTGEQYSKEENGGGVFTTLLVDALNGAASNLVGDITPGSVYAHIDQSLGPWAQRPVFKTNVKRFISLRKVCPPIEPSELRRISKIFLHANSKLQLDPGYEPERTGLEPPGTPPPDADKGAIFKILQRYNRLNLLVPEDVEHMWHAAMQSKSVRLTALGEHYWRLSKRNRI